jgi:hypothetical protein
MHSREDHAGTRPHRAALVLLAPVLLLGLATGCIGEPEEDGQPPEVAFRLLDAKEQPTISSLDDLEVGEDCAFVDADLLANGTRVLVWARDPGGLAEFSFGFVFGTGGFTVESVAPTGAVVSVGPEAGFPGWLRVTFTLPDPPGPDVQQSALAYIRLKNDDTPGIDAKATDLAGNSSRTPPFSLRHTGTPIVCIGS